MRLFFSVSIILSSLLFSSFTSSAQDEQNFTRSIYVPISFMPCDHFKHITMTMNDFTVDITSRPRTQIFQFTYYNKHKRILPRHILIHFNGTIDDKDETDFSYPIAVGVGGIQTSQNHVIRFNETKLIKQFSSMKSKRMDFRYPLRELPVQCSSHTHKKDKNDKNEKEPPIADVTEPGL